MIATERHPSGWRWFPAALILALAAVAAVNCGMAYLAFHTFPGTAAEGGYDLGRAYDRVLAEASHQAALGWRVSATAGSDRRLVLRLSGAAFDAGSVTVDAQRPVGPAETRPVALARDADGRFVARDALPPGRWTLLIGVARGGDRMTSTQRLLVR